MSLPRDVNNPLHNFARDGALLNEPNAEYEVALIGKECTDASKCIRSIFFRTQIVIFDRKRLISERVLYFYNAKYIFFNVLVSPFIICFTYDMYVFYNTWLIWDYFYGKIWLKLCHRDRLMLVSSLNNSNTDVKYKYNK